MPFTNSGVLGGTAAAGCANVHGVGVGVGPSEGELVVVFAWRWYDHMPAFAAETRPERGWLAAALKW